MSDRDQMPFLLELLDDPSTKVQASVKEALRTYGEELWDALDAAEASDEQRVMIERLIDDSADAAGGDEQLFQVGQLVRHKRYGYRGVVVAVDAECQADEEWYKSNKTQPDRDQPWYHVLADGSDDVFYPAQTSLEADDSDDVVKNPNVKRFFSEFLNGVYVRNDRPFPSTPSAEQGSGGSTSDK